MDYDEYRRFAHDIKNHLTGATLQVQVMSMLLKDEHKDRLSIIADELQKAGDMLTDLQQNIKEAQLKHAQEQGAAPTAAQEADLAKNKK